MNLFFLQDRLWDAFVLHVKFSTLSHLSQIVTQDGTMCNYWTMSLWLCDGRNVTGNKMFNMNKIIFSWILWPAQCTIRANIFLTFCFFFIFMVLPSVSDFFVVENSSHIDSQLIPIAWSHWYIALFCVFVFIMQMLYFLSSCIFCIFLFSATPTVWPRHGLVGTRLPNLQLFCAIVVKVVSGSNISRLLDAIPALSWQEVSFWKAIWSGQTQRKVSAGRGASSLLPVQICEVEKTGGVTRVKTEGTKKQILDIWFIVGDRCQVIHCDHIRRPESQSLFIAKAGLIFLLLVS